jgi:hypothetical protein
MRRWKRRGTRGSGAIAVRRCQEAQVATCPAPRPQKEFNSGVDRIRWMIEQVISHFKNWKIMSTDYRHPFKTFATTISAVVGLHFYRIR